MDRTRRSIDRAWLAAVGALALLAWAPVALEDTWLYAATGRWVVENSAIPRTDPFSWTSAGEPWQSNGWLWGVLLWGAWSIGTFAAIAVLKPLFVVLLAVVLRTGARAMGSREGPAAVASLVGVLAVFPWLVERPQLASYLLAPVVTVLAARAPGARRPWLSAIAVFAVTAAWVNLHSVALSAIPVIAAAGAGAVWDARRDGPIARPLVAAGSVVAAAVLGTLVNPWGVGVWTHAVEVRSQSSGTISEWEPLWRSGAAGWLLLGAIGVCLVVAHRWGASRRLAVALPLLATAVMAVDAIRSVPVFVVVAAVLLPALTPASSRSIVRPQVLDVGAVALLVVALVLAVPRVASTGEPAAGTPVAATSSLPSGCRLLNDYRFGNWVMWDRPDVPVSDDGRNDLHGDTSTLDGWLRGGPDAVEQLTAAGVDCVLVAPDAALVDDLTPAGWEVVGRDGSAVALRRPG